MSDGYDNAGFSDCSGDFAIKQLRVEDLEEFSHIFAGNLSPQQRQCFSDTLFHDDVGSNGMRNILDQVYGIHTVLDQEALEFIDDVFPIKVNFLSGKNIVIDKDIVIYNELPYLIDADNLIFDGGSISVTSTILTLKCNSLDIKKNPTSDQKYHLGVKGIQGDFGHNGKDANPNTSTAKKGRNANCNNHVEDGGNGHTGATGNTGHTGEIGGDSPAANLVANLTINSLDSSSSKKFVFFTQSGVGGTGGVGGAGGRGGTGGTGGNGCHTCTGTYTLSGSGGEGGKGGKGGTGGQGGGSVNGTPSFITLPADSKHLLDVIKKMAIGQKGPGGTGAVGGPGGHAGRKTKAGRANPGSQGDTGDKGDDGKPGDKPGSPGEVHILYI